MTHISIQVTMVKAFEASELIGETTTDELEDYCKTNNIELPTRWDENDSRVIEIVEDFFS